MCWTPQAEALVGVGQQSVKGDELGLCTAWGALRRLLLLHLLLLTTRGSHLHTARNEDETAVWQVLHTSGLNKKQKNTHTLVPITPHRH